MPTSLGLLLLLLQQGDTIRQELRIQFGLGDDEGAHCRTLLWPMALKKWLCLGNPMEIRQVQEVSLQKSKKTCEKFLEGAMASFRQLAT